MDNDELLNTLIFTVAATLLVLYSVENRFLIAVEQRLIAISQAIAGESVNQDEAAESAEALTSNESTGETDPATPCLPIVTDPNKKECRSIFLQYE